MDPVLHTCDSSRWFTPQHVIEASREFLGAIDLDPASDKEGNKRVGAARIFTCETDGLDAGWGGMVFLNPPSPPEPWWAKLSASFEIGEIRRAVYVAYSIEQLSQSQGWKYESSTARPMTAYHVCIPSKRLRFLRTAGDALEAATKGCDKLVKLDPKNIDPKNAVRFRALALEIRRLESMNPNEIVEGASPAHANAIIGLGGTVKEFRQAFGRIGAILEQA